VDAKVVVGPVGRVAGLFVAPAAADSATARGASAAGPDGVVETLVTVGEGEGELPGTLTTPDPTDGTARPAVVFVHGSGPLDRDATIGPNRPFRDLALGLARRGIVGLRYDKRTKVAPEKLVGGFTVKEEVLDDALAAVARLRRTPGVAPDRIFVVGHSLGGTLAPRIAAADPAIAGLVILAGATVPLEEKLLAQTRWLAGDAATASPEKAAELARLEQAVAQVQALTPADRSDPRLILGAPAAYWLDLRATDGPGLAQRLGRPIFLGQGGRDYQVTAEDFAGWKRRLDGAPFATFRFYPELDHLLMAGPGPSSPADYLTPRLVDQGLIADLATWILAQQR